MLTFIKRTEIIKPVVVANKHERSKLDLLRQEIGLPIAKLNKMLPELVGRQVKNYGQLSLGETKYVVEYLKRHQWKLEKEARKALWK